MIKRISMSYFITFYNRIRLLSQIVAGMKERCNRVKIEGNIIWLSSAVFVSFKRLKNTSWKLLLIFKKKLLDYSKQFRYGFRNMLFCSDFMRRKSKIQRRYVIYRSVIDCVGWVSTKEFCALFVLSSLCNFSKLT